VLYVPENKPLGRLRHIPVATGQEGAVSFVLPKTAESARGERPRCFLSVIEFIIDLLLNHGGVSVMRIN